VFSCTMSYTRHRNGWAWLLLCTARLHEGWAVCVSRAFVATSEPFQLAPQKVFGTPRLGPYRHAMLRRLVRDWVV
jgi:hypothetical protein